MKHKQLPQTPAVLLSCFLGVVSALLHWLIPTRILLGNGAEFACAAVAAVCGVAAFCLLLFGFVVPRIRAREGFGDCLPALFWSVLGQLFGAAATTAKLVRGLIDSFVPVQTEGAAWSFSVLILINVPVLCCFAVLYLLERHKNKA